MTQQDRLERIRACVEFLCSRECAGRAPGTPEGEAARAWILREFEAAGLGPAGEDGFLQGVPGCRGANLIGKLGGGAGPLGQRAVLVGAHYDHLGQDGDCVYWGADDNAAAVAILLDVARQLGPYSGSLQRQLLLVAFDGEEPPHFLGEGMGSVHYTRRPVWPLAQTDMMVCMDLVGHAVGPDSFPAQVRQSLFVLGAELSRGSSGLVDRVAARASGVVPRRLGHDVISPLSDYYAFQQAQVPILFLSCGRWEHYHQPSDTPDRLDYDKILATADFLADLTRELCNRPEPEVGFLAGGRDDLATMETLLETSQLLAPQLPAAGMAAPLLAPLIEKVRAGGELSQEERGLLPILVAQLESVLG